MRLGIFSDNFYPEISGVADSILLLGRELAARGHEIFFYVPRYSRRDYQIVNLKPSEATRETNIKIRRFFSWPFVGGTQQGRLFIPGPKTWQQVARDNLDLLYVQDPFGTGWLALKAARKLKIPLLGTNHTAVTEFIKINIPGTKLIKKLALKYYAWYYNHCALVTGPSQWVYDSLRPAGFARPYQVISNPLDFKIFSPVSAERQLDLKKELGFSDQTITFAGRLASEKKINIILQAVALVKEKIPNINFALVGNGQDLKLLTQLATTLEIKESVKFLGRLDQAKLAQIFQASEIFVTASTSETQGMTVLQAMACGRPAIGVRSGALPEYINNYNGLIVEPDKPEALAAAIEGLLNDAARQKSLGVRAFQDVQSFSREKITDRWENIFQELI